MLRFFRSIFNARTGCLVAGLLCAASVRGDELRLSARQLFELSSVQNLQLSADGKSIELIRGLLIENDGDAAGFSYKPNEEVLSPDVAAVKYLRVELPRPREILSTGKNDPLLPPKAFLLVGHTGKQLTAAINDQAVNLGEPKKAGNYWKLFEIPPAALVSGSNKIVLSGDGKLWIARRDERGPVKNSMSDRKQQSFKIYKRGIESEKLGTNDDIEGEYYVRLFLDGFLEEKPVQNSLRFPIPDVANLSGKSITPHRVRVKRISIALDGDLPQDLRLSIAAYTQKVTANGELTSQVGIASAGSPILNLDEKDSPRSFEVVVHLPAMEPGKSSRLRALQIIADVEEESVWKNKVELLAQANAALTISDANFINEWRFDYERLDHPRLAQLRNQYKLDEVVKGCTTDLERMQKLAVWSSQQWTKGHLKDIYPKWDALEILKLHEDGTPVGGFCQQYNIVFLQACESFGMVGRCVSIGAGDHGVNIRSGHEVVEIWSNELNKWVYVDGQAAWYFVDKETRTPLNLLELRERQIGALKDRPFRETEVVVLAKSPYEWKGLKEWPAFCELRMIPHTKFLDGELPLPLNQGMRGWFWTGHRVWTDELMPASILYDKRITNPRDWNFGVNQTQFWLTQREKEGELDVRLAHNMPSFGHYVIKFDDGEERIEKSSDAVWPLKNGENRFQVQAVNVLGLKGPASWVRVKYEGGLKR